jgi:ribA/ribD-fused uncharacterized protein
MSDTSTTQTNNNRTGLQETENGFRDEYFFLSNFFVAPVTIDYQGEQFTFSTGEHLFQGMKVAAALQPEMNVSALHALEKAPTPAKAKYWGRSIRIDVEKWNKLSEQCMKRTLELKFSQHPDLMKKLVDTGELHLVEYNDWNDKLWGKSQQTREGQNKLGKLLMELRDEERQRLNGSLLVN